MRAPPAEVYAAGSRGSYSFLHRRASVKEDSLDSAIHEYVHHLQATLPGFQRVFREEHIRRTTLPDGTRKAMDMMGRRHGGYLDLYMGEFYPADVVKGAEVDLPDAEGIEVPSRAFQIVLDSVKGKEWLHGLANKDPDMLDLVLGMLFRFDP